MIAYPEKRRSISFFLLFACLISAGFTIFRIVLHIQGKSNYVDQSYIQSEQETKSIAQQINNSMQGIQTLTTTLAQKLTTGELNSKDLEAELEKKPIEIYGFGVAYVPSVKQYAPYFVEKDGVNTMMQLSSLPGYMYYEQEWFKQTIGAAGRFFGPFSDKISQTDIIEFAVPFYASQDDALTGASPIGVVYATQSMDHLNHILKLLHSAGNGYSFLVADNRVILTHPLERLLYSRTTLSDFADQQVVSAGEKALQGESSATSYQNTINGDTSWLFCEPITKTGWILCGVYIKKEIDIDQNQLRRQLIVIICSVCITLFLASLLACVWFYSLVSLWVYACMLSLYLLASIIGVWYVAHQYPFAQENVVPVYNTSDAYAFLEKNIQFKKGSKLAILTEDEKKNLIPTGIFIQNLHFVSENQIQIVGYVWQHYNDTLHAGISRGFILPMTMNNDATTTKIEEVKKGDITTIIWHVNAIISQDLSYERYPFDVKNLRIKIMHNDFERNVNLIPDFASYTLISPTSLPGIHRRVDLLGWKIQRSYFGYRESNYNTVFGLYKEGPFGTYDRTTKTEQPELHFNIQAGRILIDTLISHLLPLAVIIFMLFIMALLCARPSIEIINFSAALFFGAIFSQLQLRSKIPPSGLVYFENFYFIVYCMMIVVMLITILHILNLNVKIVRYKDDVFLSFLFWPLILSAALGVTLVYLY